MRLLAISLAFVIFATVGCGDDDDTDTSGTQNPTAAETSGTESGDKGDGTATEQDEPSQAEFIRAADRICSQARKELGASGGDLQRLVGQLQKGEIDKQEYYRRSGDLTAEFGAGATRAIDEIEALPQPSARQSALDAYLDATREQVRLLEEQAAALRDADLQASAELNVELTRARTATQKAAREFGFHRCGGG